MNSTQKYISAVDELTFTKRQLAGLRIKYSSLEADKQIIENNKKSIQKQCLQLRNQIEKLRCQNKILQGQKNRFITEYTNDIDLIKSQLIKKQEQIHKQRLKYENTTNLGNNLLKKQIELQIQSKFADQLQNKENIIQSLRKQNQRSKRQSEIQKQKLMYQIKQLKKQIEEYQAKELVELRESANKAYTQSYNKIFNSEQSMLKNLRRQLNQLRNVIAQKDNQIDKLIDEKNRLLTQRGAQAVKFQQQTLVLHQQLRQAKLEYQTKVNEEVGTMKNIMNREKSEKRIQQNYENNEVRKLKIMNEDLEYQCINKQKLIKNLRSQNQQLLQSVKKHKKEYKRIQEQNDYAIKELEMKIRQKQQIIHKNRIHNNQNYEENIKDQTNKINRKIHKEFIKTQINNVDKIQNHQNNMINNKIKQKDQSYHKTIEIEFKMQKQRHLQTKQQLIGLQHKNEKLKKKLEQANNKVVQLIRNKVAMATSPMHPERMITKNIQKTTKHNNYRNDPENNEQTLIFNQAPKKFNQFLSPQQKLHKTQNSSLFRSAKYKQLISNSNQRQFYEKSISLSKKRKEVVNELRCMNHDCQQQSMQGQYANGDTNHDCHLHHHCNRE